MHYFILGDININTSASSTTRFVNEMLKMLNSNSAASIINVFTRVTKSSFFILDHFLTNENCHPPTPAVVDYDLTDHYPVMAIVSNKLKISCDDDKSVFKRSFAEFSTVNFNQELHDRLNDFLIRNVTINENNFDHLRNKFHSIITQTIGKHAPLKKLTRRQKRLQRRP